MRVFPVAVVSVIFLFSGFRTLGQSDESWKKFRVLPSHVYYLNSRKLFHNKRKSGIENNIADFYLYRNGEPVKPPKNIRFDFFPAGCLCFKYDDTLLLNSGLGSSVGVGVGIKIYGGKFTGSLHANNQNKLVYKQSLDDSVYQNNILAEPVSQSLKLYRNPSYAAGEVIIGEYRATYKKFYQKNAHNKNETRRYEVRIIFKCRVTGGVDSMKTLTGMNTK